MSERRIFLSAGHSSTPGRDRGASSVDGKYIEGVLAAELRSLIFKYLQEIHNIRASIDKDDTITAQTINLFKHYTNPRSILVDLHFNANDKPTAQGVEVVIPKIYSPFELKLAGDIANAIHQVTDFKLRNATEGIKGVIDETRTARQRLGWMSLVGENILIEVCFVSNPVEMSIYTEKKEQIAKAIACVLAQYTQK